jgi:hypothetical protein
MGRRGHPGVVCVDAQCLGASLCGRGFDAAFLADLPEGADACGANGEFHSFAFGGPRRLTPVAHGLVAVHDVRQTAPVLVHPFVAELR